MIDHIDLASDDDDDRLESYARNMEGTSDKEVLSSPSPPPPPKKGRKGKGESKTALQKKERELMAQERRRKQAMKPGNCMKHIKVVASADLLQNDYAGDLILALNKAELAYKVDVNPLIPSSICWERQDPLDDESVESEDHIVVFMNTENFVSLISTYKLNETVREMQVLSQKKQLTLAVYELENYFRYQKTQKNREFQNEVRGQNSRNPSKKGGCGNAVKVGREQVECSLAELEILLNCGHIFLNSPTQVSSYICQYTKAVAEAPFKREKKSKGEQQLEWFAMGDSKGTVRVDKQGNGLARLWRQQLCQFNLAGLESSEAIAFMYPSPKALVQAYGELSHDDAQLLLQNIQLRRGAGPLSSERRIGPQLSRKMHTFFTGLDGSIDISKD